MTIVPGHDSGDGSTLCLGVSPWVSACVICALCSARLCRIRWLASDACCLALPVDVEGRVSLAPVLHAPGSDALVHCIGMIVAAALVQFRFPVQDVSGHVARAVLLGGLLADGGVAPQGDLQGADRLTSFRPAQSDRRVWCLLVLRLALRNIRATWCRTPCPARTPASGPSGSRPTTSNGTKQPSDFDRPEWLMRQAARLNQ